MSVPINFRSFWDECGQIVTHDELVRTGLTRNADEAYIVGWDTKRELGSVDVPREGVWRAVHPNVLHRVGSTSTDVLPILDLEMNAAEIEAALWRQLRIFPFIGVPENEGTASQASASGQGISDPFSVVGGLRSREDGRDYILRSLILATPQDAAEYLSSKLGKDLAVGRLLLAKDFCGALRQAEAGGETYDLWNDPWPLSVQRRLRGRGHQELIPPFAYLVLLAELSRLAQNVCAHIQKAYDENGQLRLISHFNFSLLSCCADSCPPIFRQVAANALLQTTALLPPDVVWSLKDADLGIRWTTSTSDLLRAKVDRLHDKVMLPLAFPEGETGARNNRDGIMAHPALSPNNGSKQKHRFRSAGHLLFYGLTTKMHAMVGALQIRAQAEAWCAASLSERQSTFWKSAKDGRPLTVQQAAALLHYLWLETTRRAALVREVSLSKRSHEQMGSNELVEQPELLAEQSDFGLDLLKRAVKVNAMLPGPGERGYSSWYRPHLWVSSDGDDLECYEQLLSASSEKELCARSLSATDLGRIPPSVIEQVGLGKRLGPARRRRRSLAASTPSHASGAACFAQRAAMTVSATATDPMWFLLLKQQD